MNHHNSKPSLIYQIVIILLLLSIASYTVDVMDGMLSNLEYGSAHFSFLRPLKMLFVPIAFLLVLREYKHITITKPLSSFTWLCLFSTIVTAFFRGVNSTSLFASIWIPYLMYCFGQIYGKKCEYEKLFSYLFIGLFAVVLFFYLTSSSVIYSTIDAHLNIVYVPLLCMLLLFFSKNKYINMSAYLIMAGVLLGSGKRAGIVALAAAFFLHYIYSMQEGTGKKQLISLAFVFFAITFIFQEQILGFIDNNRTLNRFSNDSSSDISSGRIEIYEKTLSMYFHSSFFQTLVGHGFGAVAIKSPLQMSAHNDFLEVLYDYGIVGFILYLSFHVRIVKELLMAYRKKIDDRYILLFIYVCFFTLSMVSQMYNYPYFYILTLAIGYFEGKYLCRKN